MKRSSAGTKSKIPSTSSTATDSSKPPKDKPKCPTPRYSSFSIDSVLSPYSQIPSSTPFKFLKFETTSSPTHRRQPSVLINDTNQIYQFHESLYSSSEDISDEECILEPSTNVKNSVFASTADRKSSNCESLLRKHEEMDYSEYQEMNTKADENFTTQITCIQEGRETPVGILPKKMFCQKCKLDTTTQVKLKMPTLPFWRVLCCMSLVTDSCYDLEDIDKFQEFQHKCRVCGNVLATGYPL